jgi:TetR/AcrR family transcriptional repressor of nem operon
MIAVILLSYDDREPAMNAKVEQKEQSHETILQSAGRLLRERGIAGARVADVMHGAGLTVGGFYAHFATKEALIDAALRRTAREMRERLFEGLEAKAEAVRAEVVLKRYLSAKHRDDVGGGCSLPAVVGEVATTAGVHRAALEDQLERFANELEPHVAAGEGISARHAALGMIALMYGGLSLARAVAGSALSDELLRACRAFGRSAIAASAAAKPQRSVGS